MSDESLFAMDEHDILDLLSRWVAEEPTTRSEAFLVMSQYIRVGLMDRTCLVAEMDDYPIVIQEFVQNALTFLESPSDPCDIRSQPREFDGHLLGSKLVGVGRFIVIYQQKCD